MRTPAIPLRARRPGTRLFFAALLAAAALAPGPRSALADSTPASTPAASESPRAKAGARLDEGIRLFQKGMFDAALAEFLESRRLYPFRSALFNAALCLEKLGRHDEALEAAELLLREIDDEATPEGARDKERAQLKIIEASRHVGTVTIDGAEPGATLSIDGRQRGEYPLVRSIRVAAGNHMVRVFKSGFEPVEERIDVAGGASVRVRAALLPLARTGRVQIQEKGGHEVMVEIDGNPVGKAPWDGMLAPGAHVVRLRGAGDLGTPPVSLAVEADRNVTLSLAAEDLASAVRVEPTPANASVAIDKVTVGSGVWDGRLRPGAHTVEVAAPGFLPETRQITLARGDRPTLRVELVRDPSSPFAPRVASFYVEAETAAVVAGTLAGAVERSCGDGCASAPGLGGRALVRLGYEGNLGLGGGIEVGYLGALYRATGRKTRLMPVGQDLPEIVTVDDSVWIRGATLGLFAGLSVRLGSGLLFDFRIGGGVLVGAASDARVGSAGTRASGLTIEPTGEKRSILGGYVAPDVSLGLAGGVRAAEPTFLLVAEAPATLHYTTDGSTPVPGQAHTFSGRSPLEVPPSGATGVSARRIQWFADYDLLGPETVVHSYLSVTDPQAQVSFGALVQPARLSPDGAPLIIVAPGGDVEGTVDFAEWVSQQEGYCPTCIVQLYAGIKDAPKALDCNTFKLPHPTYPGKKGTFVFQGKAPMRPGRYPLRTWLTLDYKCTPDKPASGENDEVGLVIVQ